MTSRVLLESGSICCVNIFLLITGWGGVKQNLRHFCSFVFRCMFFSTSIYLIISLLYNRGGICVIFHNVCFFLNGIGLSKHTFVSISSPPY